MKNRLQKIEGSAMKRKIRIPAVWVLAFVIFAAQANAQTATPTPTVLSFNPAAVGISHGSAQQKTASFLVTGYAGSFTPTAALHYGIDYTKGSVTCKAAAGGETCTVPVSFLPNLPGGHRDALFLMNGTMRLATVLLYGVGQGPLALLEPGVVSSTPSSALRSGGGYIYESVVDDSGTVYVNIAQQVVSVTKAGAGTVLPISTINANDTPESLGIDGAGILYSAALLRRAAHGPSIITYDTVQGAAGAIIPPFAGYWDYLAVGNTGNVYAMNMNNMGVSSVYTVQPANPTGTALTNMPGSESYVMTVNDAEDPFISGSDINEITAAGAQTQVNNQDEGAEEGIGVDAAGTLYVTRYAGGGVAQLPAANYNVELGELDASAASLGLSVGNDGKVYVGNGSNLDVVDRSQYSISFGEQSAGVPSKPQWTGEYNVGVYNGGNGAVPLTISGIAFDPGDTVFTLASPGADLTECTEGLQLSPGEMCQVAVVMTGPQAGTFNGVLTFTTNSLFNPESINNVALTGYVEGVYLTATPSSLSFAPQITGTTSASQPVKLFNSGYNGIALAGTITSSNSAFAVTPTSCSIDTGSNCKLYVTFTPPATQTASTYPYNATFIVPYISNEGGPSLQTQFTASGTGILAEPVATLSATTVSFPSGNVGGAAESPLSVTLTNTGNAPLTGITIGWAPGSDADFTFVPATTCGSTLPYTPGSNSCTIWVAFTPATAGRRTASIGITDNATPATQSVTVKGTGIAPEVSLSTTTLAFGNVPVGQSASKSVTLRNTGNATLNAPVLGFLPAGTTEFTASGCPTAVPKDNTCTITVTFTPTATGPVTGMPELTITDNANYLSNAMQTVWLSGAGVAPEASLSTTSLAFGNTPVGSKASKTVTLTNTGTAALNAPTLGFLPANTTEFTASGCSAVVLKNSSCKITVTFAPTAAGPVAGSPQLDDYRQRYTWRTDGLAERHGNGSRRQSVAQQLDLPEHHGGHQGGRAGCQVDQQRPRRRWSFQFH